MAVNFIDKKKKEKYLVIITIVMFLGALVVLWFGYLKDSDTFKLPVYEPNLYPENAIVIDFRVFENPFLKELQAFPPIPEYEGDLGKVNPFK